jgi:hypothetical protein
MRLVVWNCCMGLHAKFEALLALRPDIAIVAECAGPEVRRLAKVYSTTPTVSGRAWVGENQHKGLAVLTFGQFGLGASCPGPPEARYSLHVGINGHVNFNLLAVWSQRPGYVENVHAALAAHREVLGPGRAILAGDLNSSAKFDREHTPNHSDLVKRLRDEFNMVSAYHSFFQEQQGDETRPTHVHNTRKTTFHIDYIFIPAIWVERLVRVEVGRREEWGQYSDHLPLVAEFDAELGQGSDCLPMPPDHASSRPSPA